MRMFFATLLLSLASLPAAALTPQQVLPARASALGGSRFAASGADAIFLNPAALAAQLRYDIQVDYGRTLQDQGDGFSAALADSLSNPSFATGLAYRRVSIGPKGALAKGSIYDTALAHPVSDNVVIGLRVSWLDYTLNGKAVRQFTGDVGALMKLGPVSLGVIGYRLLAVDSADAPRGVATGASFGDGRTYLLAGDVRWDFPNGESRRSWSLAGEYFFNEFLPLRAGYQQDSVRGTREISAGTGFVTSDFGFDLSCRRDLVSAETTWLAGMKLFVR